MYSMHTFIPDLEIYETLCKMNRAKVSHAKTVVQIHKTCGYK